LVVDEFLRTHSILEILDALPCGVSITTSCKEIKYNSTAASFLRIKREAALACSETVFPPLEILRNGQKITIKKPNGL